MKYLKYILGIILILVIGFFAIGLVKPQIKYDCEVIVDKSLEEAWAVGQDEEKMADWLIGYQKMESISGTPGTVGAVSDIYFNADGQEMVIRETIQEIKPYESITMDFDSDFMNMKYSMHMMEVDGKTKISSTTIAVGNGMFSKSMVAIMSSSFKVQEDINLAALKKTIESNQKQY